MSFENSFNSKYRKYISNFFLCLFFIVSFFEIVAEYYEDKLLIWITKPLILPFLFAYYLSLTKKLNYYFLAAIVCSWVANLLFIENTLKWIIYGSVFFLVYRILIIYIVMNKVKMPSLVPLILGSIPFVFIYATICFLSFEAMGDNIYLFLIHGIFTIFLGGLSLGNYIMISNKSNLVLFLSTMLFALTQFVFVLKVYYEEANVFHALAMIMFVFGQFLLTKFIFLTEKNKDKYQTALLD
ncbi:lysoplasmalogenase [Flavobacterium sp. AS60]|uniref:lysoplasmalogenase family protein n=1 Tax=Flavobacterium anseongense TaxID=2910677 RepID=UPI001F350633|nr:lysoplasmalogenase family protein [Flavobacterium sp. AS60]MCF6128712.1 lysoplasmalogenase [Flavobacterium sp. AS60]